MLDDFKKNNQHLILPNSRVLIAVSGGVDSVVLCYLAATANWNFGIAHCNFQLRGKDSFYDEQFVKALAHQFNVSFHTITFPTQQIATDSKQSIQLIARQLRYDWLAQIRQQFNYDFIATAHHLNDSIETFIYNFAKGTGIKGLVGIPQNNKNIIRPLWFATKTKIETYAHENHIAFREDSSNAEDKYARNKIRHHVIPALKAINPNLEVTARQTIDHLKDTNSIFNWAIQYFKAQITQKEEDAIVVDLTQLNELPAPKTVLYQILVNYQFHADQVHQIMESQFTGKQFFSPTHKCLIDRNKLMVSPISNEKEKVLWIHSETQELQLDKGKLVIQETTPPKTFSEDTNVAYFDIDKLYFPLKLRRWQEGDTFQPIGMQGKHQKLQDFFSNVKLSRIAKEKVWIMESNGEICWVVGYRTSERFKITAHTKQSIKFVYSSL